MKEFLDKIASGESFEVDLTAPKEPNKLPIKFRGLFAKGKPIVQISEQKGAQVFHRNVTHK